MSFFLALLDFLCRYIEFKMISKFLNKMQALNHVDVLFP